MSLTYNTTIWISFFIVVVTAFILNEDERSWHDKYENTRRIISRYILLAMIPTAFIEINMGLSLFDIL